MATIEQGIHVSIDTATHDALLEVIRSSYDNLGICIMDVSIDWSVMADSAPEMMRLNSIEVKSSKVIK